MFWPRSGRQQRVASAQHGCKRQFLFAAGHLPEGEVITAGEGAQCPGIGQRLSSQRASAARTVDPARS
jgi:hypothetical protein